jgi:hypothetical protein
LIIAPRLGKRPNAIFSLDIASAHHGESGSHLGLYSDLQLLPCPKTNAPNALNAIAMPEQQADDERVLVKFDMARAMWPGTLEYNISVALRDAPPNIQMPLLMFPEYVSERAQKRYDLWSGIAGLILSLSITPFFMFGMAIWTERFSIRSIFIVSAVVIALLSIPFAMLRYAFRQKRLSRRAARLAELKEENGLRLAFEWTAPKSRYEKPGVLHG